MFFYNKMSQLKYYFFIFIKLTRVFPFIDKFLNHNNKNLFIFPDYIVLCITGFYTVVGSIKLLFVRLHQLTIALVQRYYG